MARMNHEEVVGECHEAWRDMHHNASLRGHLPEMRNDFEYHLFWSCLGDEVGQECEYLSDWIEEKWGWKLKFYSYGRSGATIAPSEWMNPAPCNDFGSFAAHKALEGVGSGLDGYNHDRQVLNILLFINAYWRDSAKYIPEWWADMKEANGYDEMIVEHDGKVLVTWEVWGDA